MDNRTKITEGAAELFCKYGIRAVTMDMIASHLSVSKRTIYELFSDKNELLAGVLSSMTQKHKEMTDRIMEESENIIAALFRIMEFNLEHLQAMNPAFNEDIKKLYHEFADRKEIKCEMPDNDSYSKIIKRGIKEKLFRKDINSDIVNRTLFSLFFNIMNGEIYPYELFSRREVITNTVVNYLKGISTPEGIELIKKLEKRL